MNAVLELPAPAPAEAPEAEENKLYCADDGRYYRREINGCFGRLNRADAILHFQALGLKKTGQPISPAEQALHQVQRHNRVDYAGPLCGRGVGLVEENGARILVTRPHRFIEGSQGDFPTIKKVLSSVLGATAGDLEAPRQLATLLAWLKHGREAMRHPERDLRGLVVGIVGAPDCGKSLIQDFIITPGLGGRCADPSAWLTGRTDFNGECWEAEHLVLSDKTLDGTGPQRDALKAKLKELVANSHHRLHRKGKDGITARPIWRVTLTANDDAESATILPTLDGGFSDKICYLRAHAPTESFFDEQVLGEREAFAARLKSELPAFLYEVDRYEAPAEVVGNRFGVAPYHHPAVVALLESSNVLAPLGEVLENWFDTWTPGQSERTIKTGDLFAALDDLTEGQLVRRKIATCDSHLGHQLKRLAATPAWKGSVTPTTIREGGRLANQPKAAWSFKKGGER